MRDLRERLDEELRGLQVRPVEMAEIEARTRRRVRRRRAGAFALVAVVTVGSLALLTRAFEGQEPTPRELGPIDEGWIVFNTVSWPDQPARIYRIDPDGSQLEPITRGDAAAMSPTVSPDGSTIAFVRVDEGDDPPAAFHEGIYLMDADGANLREILRTGEPMPVSVHGLAWSPDGEKIAFLRGAGDVPYELWVMEADGSSAHQLSDLPIDSFSWSPDGSRIAFALESPEGTAFRNDLYVMAADGSEPTQLSQVGRQPAWSPDGARIAFERHVREGVDHVYLLNPDDSGADPQPLWTGDGAFDSIAWSPDGGAVAIDLFDGARGCSIVTVGLDGGVTTVLESEVGGMFAQPGAGPSLCAGRLVWAELSDPLP